MLTARIEDTDKIVGLELGADDYVTKPFNVRELVARVRAVLRRTGGPAEPATQSAQRGPLAARSRQAMRLRSTAAYLDLTPTEFELLTVFLQNPGRAFSRLELLDRVQGDAYEGYERTIDAHIKNLRAKLGDDPRHPGSSRPSSASATSWGRSCEPALGQADRGVPRGLAGRHRPRRCHLAARHRLPSSGSTSSHRAWAARRLRPRF